MLLVDNLSVSCENINKWIDHATKLNWWRVNIGSGNGLVLPGKNFIPKPVLTEISDAKWRHQVTRS